MPATVSLADAQSAETVAASPVREIARATTNGKTLAVCETAGTLVLMRESTTGKKAGTLRRTARVADFADALDCGLIGS